MLKRNKIKILKKKGQSTIEYILLVAAVLGALIYFLGPNGPFQDAFNSALQSSTNGMQNMATTLFSSHQ